MNALITLLLVLAVRAALFIAGVFMIVGNARDIQDVGFNFWNVAWILLAVVFALGTRRSSSSSK